MDISFETRPPNSVTAAELVRNFAQCRETAARQDLQITHHGRATHMLVGINRYQAMKAAANADMPGSGESDDGLHLLRMLADWLEEGVILCDADMKIMFVNRAVQAICRAPAEELVDKPLLEALPQATGSLLEIHARRTVVGNEMSIADIPSPFNRDGWLRFQSFPLGSWNVLMFRDVTEEVQRHRLADVKEAMMEAMNVHGGVSYLRISVRGTIERANVPSCKLTGLTEAELRGRAMFDLVASPDRAAFGAALEDVIRGVGHRWMDVQMLTGEGEPATVHMAMVPLYGAYGVEGAVLLATV